MYPERIVCLTEETTETLYLLGLPVFAFNQRSVADILQMIRVPAGIVGCEAKGHALAADLAVQHDRIHEIPSTYILQPGPAALTDGVRLIHERLAAMYPE